MEELTSDLKVYNELKRRVEESTFKKDLQRNILASELKHTNQIINLFFPRNIWKN